MVINNWNQITWSAAGDPENWSAPDAGFLTMTNGAGGITGLGTLGDLFFIFQEDAYTVFQYQTGDVPLNFVKLVNNGCNSERTIVEIDGALYYLSNSGEIRKTNGYSDVSVSTKVRPLTNKILNGRGIKDYYSTSQRAMPHSFYDKTNNAYRLFYAGESAYCDKALNYFIDKDLFTTSSGVYYGSSMSTFGLNDYAGVFGNSNLDGKTYSWTPAQSGLTDAGTIDLGWLSSGNPKKQIKIINCEIWLHAQNGVGADDCNCTVNVSVYTNPVTNAITSTTTLPLTYNSVTDNLQKKRFQLVGAVGDYVRLVITDSGSYRNYSIDKIVVEYDVVESNR